VTAVAAASALAGLAGLRRVRRLEGRLPARVWLPWLTVHSWYFLFYHGEIYWVQLAQMSHAVQYLIFPARVQANREERGSGKAWTGRRAAAYAGMMLVLGAFAFWLLPLIADFLAARLSNPLPADTRASSSPTF